MITMDNEEDALNIFEQRPVWGRLVVNIAYSFRLPEETDTLLIINKLQDAFERLANSFPWIAGQLITEGRDMANGNTGLSKIVPSENKPRIIVKDHRDTPTVPDMEELRRSSYAVAMLDESTFASRPAVVVTAPKAKPVLQIQVNILSGGLVIVFSGCHAAMDLPGLIQVMRWFSKACHRNPFTPVELEIGNMKRRNLVPLLDSTYQQGAELSHQVPATPTAGLIFPSVPSKWATFIIPAEVVRTIKATAIATCTSAYVSTDDSLSAFLWQSIARVRAQRLTLDTTTTAARAVDVRQAVGIPREYPGLVQNNLFHSASLGELIELPLGVVASKFRDAITCSSPSLEFYTRALATSLSRSIDKNSLRVAAQLDFSSDILISSSVTSGASQLDFALGLGPAEAFRLTRQASFESVVYMMPLTVQGDVPVLMSLRDADLAALKADGDFCRYAQFVG